MTDPSIESIFESFKNLKVLVIGDVMIDAYIWGSASRISPEAPVPIVKSKSREYRLGGAANVALNIAALGATPILCAVIGADEEGDRFKENLRSNNIDGSSIVQSKTRPTTVKTRVLSGYQHIVRIDTEEESPLSEQEENNLQKNIYSQLEKADVVIFEDYDKGTLTETLIKNTIGRANELNIKTIVDPKRKNFNFYTGASIFKPNLKELVEGLKLSHVPETIEEIINATGVLQKEINVQEVFVTLSEKGLLVKGVTTEIYIPAHVRSISDVSGAGDTVVTIIALCKAAGLSSRFAAELANLGGGLVCEHVGVAPVEKEKLMEEANKYNIITRL